MTDPQVSEANGNPPEAKPVQGEVIGYLGNCDLGELEREGKVTLHRLPVKATDKPLYLAPPFDEAARNAVIEECIAVVRRGLISINTVADLRSLKRPVTQQEEA